MPRGTLDQWEAFDRVEPIGESWKQTASIISMLSTILTYIGSYLGVKDMKPSTPEELMPMRYQARKIPKQPEPIAKADEPIIMPLASIFGLGTIVKNGNDQPRTRNAHL